MEELIMPSSSISLEGMEEIFNILQADYLLREEILEKVKPDWVITSGEFTGTFPKRLFKFYKNLSPSIKLGNEILGRIGNVAKEHSLQKFYKIELDRKLWEAGKFGDRESCFWGSASFSKKMIFLLGGKALKIYSEWEEPIARCWVLPFENNFVIFNQYSTKNLRLIFSARILAQYLNYSYKKIELSIPRIYVNYNRGYLISPFNEEVEYSPENLYSYLENEKISHECGQEIPIINLDFSMYSEDLFCPHCGQKI